MRKGKQRVAAINIRWLMGFLLLAILLTPSCLQAWQKSIYFENMTVEQGLPDGGFRQATQDQYGFMWFATSIGLVKYDGYRFTVYKKEPGNPESLLSNQVFSVFIDKQGTLWLGTDLGLSRFNREQQTFTHYTHSPTNIKGIAMGLVGSIFEDHGGLLWIAYRFNGKQSVQLSQFNRQSGVFRHYRHDPDNINSLPAGSIMTIHEDRSGVLWVGTYAWGEVAGLARFVRESGFFSRFFACDSNLSQCPKPSTETDRPAAFDVSGVAEDRKGNLWIGGFGNGLIKYDRENNTYSRYVFDPDLPASASDRKKISGNIIEDNEGRLWFDDKYQGLTRFDPMTETFSHYRHNPEDPHSIAPDSFAAFQLYLDRRGIVWVVGYNNVISKFDPTDLTFGLYKHDPGDPNSLSSNDVFAIAEGKNSVLWVGFEMMGLDRIDRATGVVTHYRHDPGNPDSLHNNEIYSLYFSPSETLWIGTRSGIGRFDNVTETFQYYPVKPRAINTATPQAGGDVTAIIFGEDSKGLLWFFSHELVGQLNPVTGEVTQYAAGSEQSNGLHAGWFMSGLIAADGTVWIGSSEGLISFDPHSQVFTHYIHDPGNPESISPGAVFDIVQDHDGNIWVSTLGGFVRFDSIKKIFIHIRNVKDFNELSPNSIALDEMGDMWFRDVENNYEIWRFNTANGELRDFRHREVLAAGESDARGSLLSDSGELILSSRNGINIFDPDELIDDTHDPVVVFTEFLLLNKPVPISKGERKTPLIKNINGTSDITLTHEDYLFSFEFAAPGYKYPKNLRYAYRLKGFDTAWIETGSESRHATYTNVPAGDYVLRIKAGNGRGGWSENTAFVRLNILPPWWQTWWAYGLYIFAFVLALFTYIRVRTIGLKERAEVLERTVAERTAQITEHERHIQHQAEDLEELLHLKEKLITNISHEFRTPLTLIHGPVKRMLKSTKSQENISQLKLIRRNSRRLLRLVDQLLGLARLGSEEPLPRSSQPLTSVARAIADSFQVLAEDKGLKLTFDTAEDLWVVCSPDALDKILLNLLSNAIKFTPAGGCVSVSTRPSDDGMVELAVRDTGVGIPNEEQEVVFERFHRVDDCGESVPGAGIGLALVKELVTAYEGHIDLDSTPGEGTTVFVYLPQCQLVPESRDVKQNIPAIELSEAVELEAESLTATSGTIAVLATDPEIDAKPSILIVEDNGDMQKYLYELLSDSYHCDLAGDGQQALEKAFENIPDLVLLDVMLPKLNGFQVSHVLKEDERTSHIPIVMLTALGDRESRKVGWHEKVDGYFSKPFDDEELKLRISNLLEIRDILKSRYSSQFFDESRPVQVLNEKENGFMKKLDKVLESNHAEPEFGLSQMAENMHMSTRQLQRKLKAITGHNPAEFLRSYRLRKARELLRSGTQVGIAADAVGFSSPAYFTSCFKAQFAQTPTDYQQGFH